MFWQIRLGGTWYFRYWSICIWKHASGLYWLPAVESTWCVLHWPWVLDVGKQIIIAFFKRLGLSTQSNLSKHKHVILLNMIKHTWSSADGKTGGQQSYLPSSIGRQFCLKNNFIAIFFSQEYMQHLDFIGCQLWKVHDVYYIDHGC
jgi:hypothetical protein